MAADHLQFLKDKFINEFEEAVGEFNELPLLHFKEISEALQQKRIDPSTPIKMKGLLYDLKFALAECVMLAEKQRERKTQNKKSLLGDHNSVKELWFLYRTGQKLNHIKEKLLRDTSDDAAAERPSSSSGSVRVYQPRDFPVFNELEIHGFNDHLQKIKALLLETPATESIRSIGIVGMGGSGKTALAQMVFHSRRVQEIFSPMLWVELRDQFPNPQSIVSAIVESLASDELSSDGGSDYDLDKLLHNMHRRLLNKKYLIVLDNVWNASDWDLDLNSNLNLQMGGGNNSDTTTRLWHGLPKGCGGAIIVTTRLEEVADKMVGELNLHLRLGPLLDHESCWSIILDSVAKEISDHPKFLEMKDEMVERCDGLPLAAKSLAQIISTELAKFVPDANSKKCLLKVDLHDDVDKKKAMKTAAGLAGVESLSMDMKDKKMTVTGDVDPVTLVKKLRKYCHTQIISINGEKAVNQQPRKSRCLNCFKS